MQHSGVLRLILRLGKCVSELKKNNNKIKGRMENLVHPVRNKSKL